MTAILRPIQAFLHTQAAGGVLLLGAAVLALVWANSPLAPAYTALWSTPFTVGGGPIVISKPLLLWVNDGLMAIFFFLVGLEIKREIVAGELSQPRQAALSLAAAVGGMLVPALLYVLVAGGTDRAAGWGIPMATDIAFALGVLALVGSRAPLALKVFLTALAIVDDLGAVLVIALFYTEQVYTGALLWGAAFLGAMIAANRLGVMRPGIYLLLGLGLWVATLKSGVHATVAGVLTALTIPAVRRMDEAGFAATARDLLGRFETGVHPGDTVASPDQTDAIYQIRAAATDVESPLARLEHALHAPVAWLIMPVFALANAGVALGGNIPALVGDPAALGVILGLTVGKPVGVILMAWLAVRVGLAALPPGITWTHITGVSLLTGIGFTMSIFIANLAFGTEGLAVDAAKVGILLASVIMGAAGAVVLRRSLRAAGA